MLRYAASGVMTAATAATIDSGIGILWNASTTRRIGLKRIQALKTVSTGTPAQAVKLRRVSARGTPGATVTPTIVSDYDRALAPASAAVLDLALYSVLPTLEASDLDAVWAHAAIGAGFSWTFDTPLWINPGAGVGITNGANSIYGIARITAEWVE